MPPCIAIDKDSVPSAASETKNALQLAELRKAIPAEAFQKSFLWSTFYMFFDYSVWLGSLFCIYSLNNSQYWTVMPFWQRALVSVIYWLVCGFFMWCIFIVGHDCGHTNFSNYPIVNDILGHITHGSLLVPYFPWQLSHRYHHMYHNHVEKDYSHPWYTEESLKLPKEKMGRMLHEKLHLVRLFSPIFGWWLYLFGKPDGSHFIPWPTQRIWKESPIIESLKCLVSAAVCVVYFWAFYSLAGYSLSTLAYYYLVPLVVFGWWLTTVTYLQHHSPNTLVHDDHNWKFVDAAFETVDRKFGWGIDTLSHHITDGHVAHHLFFTKIPHYNLPIATKAIQEYMKKNDLQSLYKFEKTYDFMFRVHQYFYNLGFKAKLSDAVVRPSARRQSE
jgi:omega-3 fatty acid desaturase (delta-15 desaturase)